MSSVIKVENLSKQYRLGEISTGAISHDINRWWHKIRGKENPYLKIGDSNDRTTKGESEYVWSLKDINFEIQQGDAVGIIGRNGAGKSTLLKILSKVTQPTTGSIKTKGRIASLLEVGTGFHPELSGRDNIYLNGAILGMRKAEIKRKFDEIVDFAGVERYIDTPVKRYSSGMYVRLAFAVAAYLESEILIVDEVLAVGDAEFQKKCLGKMGEVSKGEGRTVLFVSHNMTAVQQLCEVGLLLNKGEVLLDNTMNSVIEKYLQINKNQAIQRILDNKSIFKKAQILSIKENVEGSNVGYIIEIEIEVNNSNIHQHCGIDISLKYQNTKILFLGSAYYSKVVVTDTTSRVICKFGPINLAMGTYDIDINFVNPGISYIEEYDNILEFTLERHIIHSEYTHLHQLTANALIGYIVPIQEWKSF